MFDTKIAAGIKREFENEIVAMEIPGFEPMGKVEKGILFSKGDVFVVVSAVVKKDGFDATEALKAEVEVEAKREAVKLAKVAKLAKIAKAEKELVEAKPLVK